LFGREYKYDVPLTATVVFVNYNSSIIVALEILILRRGGLKDYLCVAIRPKGMD
jgi:hypothetical protein